jgi:fatty-acyl-CoA synthase
MGLFGAISRETTYITSLARTFHRMRHVKPDSPVTITDIVETYARDTPDAVAIFYLDRTVSYRALNAHANRYARWAQSQGLKRGDVVALLMENRPDYLFAWLGMAKLGVVSALINTNLRGQALAHCISIAGARHVIVGSELETNFLEAFPLIEGAPQRWMVTDDGAAPGSLDGVLAAQSPDALELSARTDLTCKDKAFYIFTSGTTGLPKAANISHLRMLYMMYGFAGALNAKASDRMYIVLPLYHSSGGICAVGVALTAGGSMIIKRKLSVQEFWDDCFRYKPTFFQYIGEMCRYLLNAPVRPHERDHNLRAITGNGLRPEIWPAFQERFAIPKIVEFYGATEGNVSMLNYDGKVGAVGRVPSYLRNVITTRIVRFDIERELPVRGPDGFCIECAPGEAGEAVGKITQEPGKNFEGYSRATDTQKKILNDVFERGDAWFRTGDLMKQDELGYFYFVDRIGDTFRWKGENVATSEVSEALGVVPGIAEANVYGVSVPGMDGRAGMAALVVNSVFDIAALPMMLSKSLPAYARPIFLRLQPEMEITGTFKQRKGELVKEGFDPSAIADPIYWLDPANGVYEKLDAMRYADIISGRVKL